jgi:hypothetical protein
MERKGKDDQDMMVDEEDKTKVLDADHACTNMAHFHDGTSLDDNPHVVFINVHTIIIRIRC